MLSGSFSKTFAPSYRVGWMMLGSLFYKASKLKTTSSGTTATVLSSLLPITLTTEGTIIICGLCGKL